VRICYFGTYSDQEGYPMNRVLITGLAEAGAEVIPCHVRVWDDAADKMAGLGVVRGLGRALRLAWAWARLAVRFARLPDYDVLIVGYVGHLDVLPARFLTSFRPRPVVLNALVSLYDTAVVDRALVPPRSLRARLLKWLDRTAFRLADRVLIDTDCHGRHLTAAYGLAPGRLISVPVGADPTALPENPPAPPSEGPLTVLWFGTYIALHGVPTILAAARALAGRDDIRFEMLGRGQELAAMRAAGTGPNVHFDPRWVDRPELLAAIAASHVCLGVFGTGEKAGRVIPCKVYDALAMGRPVVTADTPAARELLTDGRDAVLVPPGDGAALAEALAALADDPDRRAVLGAAGHATYRARCTPAAIGRGLLAALSAP